MSSMRNPLHRLALAVVCVIPALAITTAAERTLELGSSATFAVLMATSSGAALVADRIVRSRTPRDDRERR